MQARKPAFLNPATPLAGLTFISWARTLTLTTIIMPPAFFRSLMTALFLPLLLATAQEPAPLVISEFLSLNRDLDSDEDAESSDWIEIHNPTNAAVNLDGYFLTDTPVLPQRWAFPAVTIPSGGYLQLFASGKDRRELGRQLHTNFALDEKGEYLALHHDSTQVPVAAFAPSFPNQIRNVSYGVSKSDKDRIGYMPAPTPGKPNTTTYEGFVKDTRFSADRGFHSEPFELALTTSTKGAEIRYTMDGSEPAQSHGEIYIEPFIISKSAIVRVMAWKANHVPTNIDTHTYVFASDVKTQITMDQRVTEAPDYADEIDAALGKQLPAMSVVVDQADFFGPNGIHAQPERDGRSTELPISLEYFNPSNPDDRFQVRAGIRLHGGNARTHPKKPFRLYFREEYGPTRLQHPLFDGETVDVFEQLILRSCGHDSWSLANRFGSADADIPPHASFIRDEFLRRTERSMGLVSPAGKFVHLYLNGSYWGIYNLHERPNARFYSDHLGGNAADWDVLHHPELDDEPHTIVNGSDEAWTILQRLAQNQVTDRETYQLFQEYLDLDQYIDALIVRMWSGDYDWCGPIARPITNGIGSINTDVTVFANKNWYVARNSRNESRKFHFHSWDAEMCMGLHMMFNLFQRDVPQQIINFDLSGANDPQSPVSPYAALIGYAPFKRRFADRMQKHLASGGALHPDRAQPRLQAMIELLDQPIIAESARWGNTSTSGRLLTRNDNWRPEVEWLRDEFIVERSEAVRAAFERRGIFPSPTAPTLNTASSVLAPDDKVHFSTELVNSEIYYTIDGSDPAELPSFETLEILSPGAPAIWIVPSDSNGGHRRFVWTAFASFAQPTFWHKGQVGLGYEFGDENFENEFVTDVGQVMNGNNASLYTRINFSIPSQDTLDNMHSILLKIKYDDGFIAHINGLRVASSNAPSFVNSRAKAAQARTDQAALIEESFDITAARPILLLGRNVLAIQGLNSEIDSSDFLLAPRIELRTQTSTGGPSATSQRFTKGISLDESATVKSRVLDQFGNWSALTEAYFSTQPTLKAADVAITEIHYRPLPPTTDAELAITTKRNAFEFIELANLADHTIDLTGATFTQGIRFQFPEILLEVGSRVVVVRNRAAFDSRYGGHPDIHVAGSFARDTKLSDTGETLTFASASGDVLTSFRYNDREPWPEMADGEGASLNFHPSKDATPQNPIHWSASLDPNGTPGSEGFRRYKSWQKRYFTNENALPESDPDHDGLPNLLEYAFGSHPLRPSEKTNFMNFNVDEAGPQFQFLRRPNTTDLNYELEFSKDLATWDLQALNEADILQESNVNDREKVTIRLSADSKFRYARLRAALSLEP